MSQTETASPSPTSARVATPNEAGVGTGKAVARAADRQGIFQWAGQQFGVEPGKVMGILKATCFSTGKNEDPASDAEVAALLIVAKQYGLNPFLKQIFAFRDKKGGIVPVVGTDGWLGIINQHPMYDGMEFEWEKNEAGALVSCTCVIYRKDRAHPTKITEFLDECKRNTEPWQKWPRRMLRHKSISQCGRVAFSLSGIYDEDEAERIVASGGGIPVDPGDKVLDGELEPATRTDKLAADLAKRVRREEAEDVDPDTGEITKVEKAAVTLERVGAAIDAATTQDQLFQYMQDAMKLEASPERDALMKRWNAKVLALKEQDEPEQTRKQGAAETLPAQGQSEPKPQDGAAPPNIAQAAHSTTAQSEGTSEQGEAAQGRAAPGSVNALRPAAPVAGEQRVDWDAKEKAALAEMKACPSTDALDIVMDRISSEKDWRPRSKITLQGAYRERRKEFSE